jgi:error-prone DNA polymerase
MGLTILPPDINESHITYSGRGGELRIGLMQIKGLQEKSLEAVMTAREQGAFASLEDFLRRAAIDLSEVKLLIRAGCFDGIAEECHRAQLIWKLLQLHQPKKRLLSLGFGGPAVWVPQLADYRESQKLQDEQEIFGFLMSRHPMMLYTEELEGIPHLQARDISGHAGQRVRMVAWLISSKTVWTKDEDPMSFISFEDETAIFETVFFPQAYARYVPRLNAHEPFVLEGILQDDHGAVSLHVQKALPLKSWNTRSAEPRDLQKVTPVTLLPDF